MNSNQLALFIIAFRKKISKTFDCTAAEFKLKKLIRASYLLNKRKNKNKVRKYWIHPIFSTDNRKRWSE